MRIVYVLLVIVIDSSLQVHERFWKLAKTLSCVLHIKIIIRGFSLLASHHSCVDIHQKDFHEKFDAVKL